MLLIPQRYEFSSKSQQQQLANLVAQGCCWYHKGTNFQANHNRLSNDAPSILVVADTTKVRIFKQITTVCIRYSKDLALLLIPQRYEFSSKSQRFFVKFLYISSCCWYHKGTNFQANHNQRIINPLIENVVADTTKVRIFKQITTQFGTYLFINSCCWYHKGTNFQANHNMLLLKASSCTVVADTTKVRIFKQITTVATAKSFTIKLLLIPQRYEFSSKSQQVGGTPPPLLCCCWYHKGTNFQANHNYWSHFLSILSVVADTTKVRIFKQITTIFILTSQGISCCWYHKGTNFQANHNRLYKIFKGLGVVADTTKVRIFKQITTDFKHKHTILLLLLIPQRYEFSSKSQHFLWEVPYYSCCCWYHKGTNFQANHNCCWNDTHWY